MAEDNGKEEKVEVREEGIKESKGVKEQPTGRSEGEALANVVKFIQLADSYYR